MNFDSVAKTIVANSIRSAICIDDEFVEPYEEKRGRVKDINKPKELLKSFKKGNCSLDIYTYESYGKLKEESEFVFTNRDLMILDWQLSQEDLKFEDALDVLKDAVETPSLSFVLIYTQEPNLAGIEMEIRSFFNQKIRDADERDKLYESLMDRLDEKFFFIEHNDDVPESAGTFFENRIIKEAFRDFVLSEPSDEAIKKFKTELRDFFSDQQTGGKFLKLFETSVKELYNCNNLFEGCEQMEFRNSSTFIPRKEYPSPPYCNKIHGQPNALWVNNTYITIFHKGDLDPTNVYGKFSELLCSRPGNIQTLIALEMKNNFKENSGKVGKDLLAVDERAFFHHRNNLPGKEEFFDFIRNIWKHQVASFHLNSDSEVFGVLDEYISNNRIDEKLEKISEGHNRDEFLKELAKLNYQYSFHHPPRKDGDYIRFGDIFSSGKNKENNDSRRYLLNITAHCYCLRPEKIKNKFFFVSGEEMPLKSALEKVDDEKFCFSFFYREIEPVCISWETKPFTIFIPENKRLFQKNKPIKVKNGSDTESLFYEGTLLENYTQRIANRAFAHAARVGVELAKFDSKKKSK